MTGPTDPTWPDVYRIQTSDPLLGQAAGETDPGPLNSAAAALETRTETLRTAQEVQGAVLVLQGGRVAALEESTADLGDRLDGNEAVTLGLPRAIIGGSVRLAELFTADDTLLDFRSIAVADGGTVPVIGDDSLNLASTAALIVGEPYVLVGAGGVTQEIQLAEILTAHRIRIVPNLAIAGVTALTRTTWDLSTNGVALVDPGETYVTPRLDFGSATTPGWGLVLRLRGTGMVDLEWSNDAPGTVAPVWRDAPWHRKRTRKAWTEYQFIIPSTGPTRLRITGRDGPVEIAWMVSHPTPEMTDGVLNDLPRPWLEPVILAAPQGARPRMSIENYPSGTAAAGVVYRLQDGTGAEIHLSPLTPLTETYQLPAGLVAPATTYTVTARTQAADGRTGDWSKPKTLTTLASFIYIEAPTITAPAPWAVARDGDPITLSAPVIVGGTDTITGKIIRLQEGTKIIWSTGATPLPIGQAVTIPPGLLLPGKTYNIRAAYKGATLPMEWGVSRLIATDNWLITANGNFTVPETGTYQVTAIGGGAGGSAEWSRGGTGGGAGYFETITATLLAGTILPITIGAGGLGGVWTGASGTNASGKPGGDTVIGSLLTAKGAPMLYYMKGGDGSSGGGGRDETQSEALGGSAGSDGGPQVVNPADGFYVPGGRGKPFAMPDGLIAGAPGAAVRQFEGAANFYSGSGAAGIAPTGAAAPALATAGTASAPTNGAGPGGGGGTGYGAGGGGSGSVGSGDNNWSVVGGNGAPGCAHIKKVA